MHLNNISSKNHLSLVRPRLSTVGPMLAPGDRS